MTDAPDNNAAQQAYWNDAAGKAWVELQDLLDRQLEPLGNRAIDTLAPRPGDRILDVGCGTGQTSLALAARVGAKGSVLGVDISAPMLGIAQRRAEAAGLSQARFVEADAQTFPFEAGAFDGVFSRFGVMFFADPVAAFANIRRALKADGRLAFICWRAAAENPWMTPPIGSALADMPPPPRPEPGAPGPFGFAEPDRVRTILSEAGFTDVAVEGHDGKLGGNSLEDTIRLSLNIGPLGAVLRERPERRDEVVGELRKAFSGRLQGGEVVQDCATWIVTARNP
jgi:SAM-dependent methyltransferase